MAKELTVEKPAAGVVIPQKTKVSLVIIGCVLLAIFVAGVIYARTGGSETVEEPAGKAEATAKTTTTKDAPSETLLTAVLGSGAALIIVGLLYSRISTVKLPGGVEVTMTAEEKQKNAEQVLEKLPEDNPDPLKAALAVQDSSERILREKAHAEIEVPDRKIANAAEAAVKGITS